ncbi:hypothetical protein CKO28_13730 [Rhodovibrio sodomensis]|uniref:Type I-E CRISPR-associated protein Cas7/Cse4/CasC n=1 Tax=Rhodovibrio sodomensis TaxID=1088 RepID=A0ABS1DGY0_9PROT|nr:type I-E CRISPR-associated protein Cas7/Cse4/CasC [Rhodovibrio sodomensis]MBK1669094.1 hypothetical protein [Rhodovibrio sodomensis]
MLDHQQRREALKIQLHWLVSHPCALLNRDTSGGPKTITYGGVERTRASSACQKRAWREAGDHPFALVADENSDTLTSRRAVRVRIAEPLAEAGYDVATIKAALWPFNNALFPPAGTKTTRKKKSEPARDDVGTTSTNDPLPAARTESPFKEFDRNEPVVLGVSEINYIREIVTEVLDQASSPEKAAALAAARVQDKAFARNLKAIPQACGLLSAVFGRFTLGEMVSRMDSAVHVAHLMGTHQAQVEDDPFSVLEQLTDRGDGARQTGLLSEARLTSTVFYGYAVIDVGKLIENLSGLPRTEWREADLELAGEVVERLVHLIATVSPAARKTGTAAHAEAAVVIAEIGSYRNRSLHGAFETPCGPTVRDSLDAICEQMALSDQMYGQQELRWAASQVRGTAVPGANLVPLGTLAAELGERVRDHAGTVAALPDPRARPARAA